MEALGTALLIFLLRIGDVSIGTVRVLYTVRGKRVVSTLLGLVESLVWIYAISRLVATVKESPIQMLAWAVGFAAGTALGITLEQWIGSGSVLVRIISLYHAAELRTTLRSRGLGVTAVQGEGRDGAVLVLFVVAPRRRGKEVVATVQQVDPDAFITVETVTHAIGGYAAEAVGPASFRK